MKKAALVIVAMLIALIIVTSCKVEARVPKRFQVLHKEKINEIYDGRACVIKDKRTGKKYLVINSGMGGGIVEITSN